jgi:hypothetical protein
MNPLDKFRQRLVLILGATVLAAGCVSENPASPGLSTKRIPVIQFRQQDPDITGSVGARGVCDTAGPGHRLGFPPPSAVEVRAQCWMRYEHINATLDTKTALTQVCVNERLRGTPAN